MPLYGGIDLQANNSSTTPIQSSARDFGAISPSPSKVLTFFGNSIFEVSHWFDQCDLNSFERSGSTPVLGEPITTR